MESNEIPEKRKKETTDLLKKLSLLLCLPMYIAVVYEHKIQAALFVRKRRKYCFEMGTSSMSSIKTECTTFRHSRSKRANENLKKFLE